VWRKTNLGESFHPPMSVEHRERDYVYREHIEEGDAELPDPEVLLRGIEQLSVGARRMLDQARRELLTRRLSRGEFSDLLRSFAWKSSVLTEWYSEKGIIQQRKRQRPAEEIGAVLLTDDDIRALLEGAAATTVVFSSKGGKNRDSAERTSPPNCEMRIQGDGGWALGDSNHDERSSKEGRRDGYVGHAHDSSDESAGAESKHALSGSASPSGSLTSSCASTCDTVLAGTETPPQLAVTSGTPGRAGVGFPTFRRTASWGRVSHVPPNPGHLQAPSSEAGGRHSDVDSSRLYTELKKRRSQLGARNATAQRERALVAALDDTYQVSPPEATAIASTSSAETSNLESTAHGLCPRFQDLSIAGAATTGSDHRLDCRGSDTEQQSTA
jgi:hypothetical protein